MSKATAHADLLALVREQRRSVQRHCRQPREDNRVWSYTFDHAKQPKPVYGHFLPGHADDPAPIKTVLRHNVSVKHGWSYRQPCPGAETCPVCRYRVEHPEFAAAGDRHRYASNVLIIEDPIAPLHLRQPRVAIYEYGRELHQLIADELENNWNPFSAADDWSLLRLQATWTTKRAVPRYLPYTQFTEWLDHLGDVRQSAQQVNRAELPRLSDYPLMHDQDELEFQFHKTLEALSTPEPPSDPVRAAEFR